MKENYRKKIYSKYVSVNTLPLYGEASLEKIKKQFPVWQKYFGRFLPENKNAKIIDIGCGNGSFVYWFQQLGYSNVEGIDISREQIEQGKRLGIRNIREGDFREILGNGKEKYDMIFMRDVIEHFRKEEIIEISEKLFGSLKEGGALIVQTPNAEGPFGSRFRYLDFTHEVSFTKNSARQLFLANGFKKVEVYPTPFLIHGVKSFIRAVLWKFIEFSLRFYMLVETGLADGVFTQNMIVFAKK